MRSVRSTLDALASLKLTVALLAAAMALIFAGTLVQAQQGIWQTIDGYFRSGVAWVDLQLFVPRQLAEVPWSVPVPGGLTIAGLMIVNLIAAHAARFRWSAKRVGIIVLHAGIVLLLLGEFVAAFLSEEGLMSIDEGGSASYAEDFREVELAVLSPRGDDAVDVVAIPERMLVEAADTGERITHPGLPFAVGVGRWMPNAQIDAAQGETGATQGIGTQARATPLPRVRGVDGGDVDAPAGYVTLYRGDEPLGTWLVSVNLVAPQPVAVGERSVDLELRFKRTYKAYTLHLIDFRHDKFVGTEIPRNFSSRVRLVDPSRGTDREVLISMNSPLRYAGETFYQSSFKPDDTGTVLQVVRNPGWLIPYLACVLVGGGMLVHFTLALTAFLRRTAARPPPATMPGPPPRPSLAWRITPWAAAALGLLVALSGLFRPSPASPYDLGTLARMPVSAGGRVKPMDTVARSAVMLAGGRQEVALDDGTKLPAIRFVLDLIARPGAIRELPVVRVDHPDVLALLQRGPDDGGRLSLAAIEPHWNAVTEQAMRSHDVPPKQRDPFQRAVVELFDKVQNLLAIARMRSPYAVPPLAPGEEWRSFHEALLDSGLVRPADAPASPAPEAAAPHPGVAYLTAIMTAYHQGDAEAFNRSIRMYDALLRRALPAETTKARLEVLFNRAAPFYGAMLVYLLAFVALLGAVLFRMRSAATPGAAGENLRRAAVGLLWTALIVHTLGLALRIYLQGRPPVTNLYSSAVFVGWASVLLGLTLERLFPLALAALGTAVVGFATLVVAHNLAASGGGDTMQMMQAVLDSNFWLATHVVTITLGYSASFLAGALAILYILLDTFTRHLTEDRARALTRMVYGVVCFALLLSFVGTVLGGIWADQSWGRFWGWDPKENGAALVVLISAIILHARWGGLVGRPGIMVLAVAGNVVTAWSWFGTNLLGVGLHAYGFMDSGVFWLMAFVFSQFFVIAIGLVPRARASAAR